MRIAALALAAAIAAPPLASAAESQLIPDALPPWARSAPAAPRAAAKEPAAAAQKPATPAMPATPAAPVAAAKTEPSTPKPPAAESGSTAPTVSAQDGDPLSSSPLTVVRWGFSATAQPDDSGGFAIVAQAGRPLQLWLTIEGQQPAVEQLRAGGRLAIKVHWERADKTGSGAQDLSTELTVGRPDLAANFASQVQRQGHFEWHLWSRKDTLTAGQWIVSLTYPDGAPVRCGQAPPQPCRLQVTAS